MSNKVIDNWHQFINSKDPAVLAELLAADVSFHSPIVHAPQKGKAIATMYLSAAAGIFNSSFTYVREIIGEHDAALEFLVEIDGLQINGVDLISWSTDDEIIDFKVLLRPLKAINLVHQKMAEKLHSMRK